MANELGIRMKVLKNTGRLVDTLDREEEEFQHLIVMPYNPLRGKCAVGLRLLFFGLLSLAIFAILYVVVRDHGQRYWMHPHHMLSFKRQEDSISILQAKDGSGVDDMCFRHDEGKFDCHPAPGATPDTCLARGCCWKPLESKLKPWCYYPTGHSYYSFGNFTTSKRGTSGTGVLTRESPYPEDVKDLKIDVIYETEDIVRIKITDLNKQRYEVPLEYKESPTKPQKQNYTVKLTKDGFQVFRLGDLTPIFDTTIAPIVYANQFLEISTTLQTQYLYGIGESVGSLNRGVDWKPRYVLYSHDRIPAPNSNNYGSHPFYMVMDKTGRSYGVFLANSNAMEVTVIPAPALTFRSIGGIIDLRIFIGPSPSDVTNQYTSIIGRSQIPPYWSLGFHLCRFNYGSVNHTKQILDRNLQAGLPIDVQWNDLDYMHNNNDFTYDPVKYAGLPDFISEVHQRGMRYVPLVDPGISAGEGKGKYTPYDYGIKMDIFVKDYKGDVFKGKVWNPVSTVWPDFSHPNITQYWLYQLESFRKNIQFDGAWIDMNEPSNFYDGTKTGCVTNSKLDNPPYKPQVDGGSLFYKTICSSARQAGGRHYDLHNLYGTQETIATYKVLGDLTGERPFVISRSTFPGQGRYGGHWTGDVVSNWSDMKLTIPQILTFGLFGIPMVGADICGFNGNTTVDLCKRWQQLGAFYPFARNHNTDDGIPQDPASLGPEVLDASKETLKIRYDLLPYIYSLFFRAHLTGQPVARALFFEFPTDVNTFNIDTQFLLGPAVMIVPILQESFTGSTVKAYLPQGYWYSHYTKKAVESLGEELSLPVPTNSIPILYRGGSIIVKQEGGLNTVASRKNKFFIEVYLAQDDSAVGEFFWDDGVANLPKESIQYNQYSLKASKTTFWFTKVFANYDETSMKLDAIKIYGVRGNVKNVLLNNVDFPFVMENKMLLLHNMNFTGSAWTDGLTLIWSY